MAEACEPASGSGGAIMGQISHCKRSQQGKKKKEFYEASRNYARLARGKQKCRLQNAQHRHVLGDLLAFLLVL
jgi:hypothetical protein